MVRDLLVTIMLALMLGACSRSGQDAQGTQDNVWQTQIDAVHKAQGVERQELDQFERQRRMMEEQGG